MEAIPTCHKCGNPLEGLIVDQAGASLTLEYSSVTGEYKVISRHLDDYVEVRCPFCHNDLNEANLGWCLRRVVLD